MVLIEYAGEHEGKRLFLIPSFTDKSAFYEILIDPAEGKASCTCMDCQCRRKQWFLWIDNPDVCKHLRHFRRFALPFFQEQGLIE